MTIRHKEAAAIIVLAILTGCRDDIIRPYLPPPPASTIYFEHIGYPNSWEAVGLVGETLTHRFAVLAHNGSRVVSGLRVVWAVSGSASIVPAEDTTTRAGYAEAALTLGTDEGDYAVTATALTLPGSPQLAFRGTAVSKLVEVRDLVDGGFVPAAVTVISGHSIGWKLASAEGDVHDVTFEDDPTKPVSSGNMWDLWSGVPYHTRIFNGAPRTIRYRCRHHSTGFVEGEVGTVTVQ